MRLEYEPAAEPLHIFVKQLRSHRVPIPGFICRFRAWGLRFGVWGFRFGVWGFR